MKGSRRAGTSSSNPSGLGIGSPICRIGNPGLLLRTDLIRSRLETSPTVYW